MSIPNEAPNRVMFGGRGRGRLVPQDILDAPLRKPVTSGIDKTHKLAQLDNLFTGPLEDLAVYRMLEAYLFKESCTDMEIDQMVEHIFKSTLLDASNVNYICKYLYVMFRHPGKGSTLRGLFYKYLEKYYKESSSIKLNRGPSEYRNFVNLFAAATHHARNVNYAPFDELIDGLLSLALKLVSSVIQEDIQVFALCVIRYSQYLLMPTSDGHVVSNLTDKQRRLDQAKDFARYTLLNNDITKKSLAWLTLVIESYSITDDLLEKYSPPIDKSALSLLNTKNVQIRLPRSDFSRYSLTDVASIIEMV